MFKDNFLQVSKKFCLDKASNKISCRLQRKFSFSFKVNVSRMLKIYEITQLFNYCFCSIKIGGKKNQKRAINGKNT